jgi:glycosyltransferase involved in cell wall biosynthesis
VHSNGIKMHLLAAIARSSAPLVWHIHDFVGERPLVSHALALFAHRADAAIAISNAVAIDARRTLPRLPSAVVHNAVDTAAFSPDGPRADLDALGGREAPPVGTVRVGLVATYARWKGHDIFLKAAGLARRHVPNVRFYIIGGPIYATGASQFSREELQRLAYDLEVDRCVLFVPFQNEIEDAYRALDIVVHASSRPEPFGRTIAEGMASGRAVVASREGGAGEIFADGIDGVGVAPRDEAALAQTIIALAADPPRRQAIAAAARLRAVEHFSRARLAGQLLRVYSSAGVR